MRVAVIGGQGYVSGELLRLLCHHPEFEVAAVVSSSQAGTRVVDSFGHLRHTKVDGLLFSDVGEVLRDLGSLRIAGVFTATPHGRTAGLVDDLLRAAEAQCVPLHVVDLSADFRFRDAARYEAIYGIVHPAPSRLGEFTCAVPELHEGKPTKHAVQPGCHATAATIAAYPFVARGLVENDVFVATVTGSSGSGRTPGPGTHHPSRRSNYVAYKPLSHRHEAEVRMFLAQVNGGIEPDVSLVPHSGPFVRGIHATLRMTLKEPREADELIAIASEVYANRPFVSVEAAMPALADVVGTNRCGIGVAVRGTTLVVTSVIDNLVKGAAGGAVQWMNRIAGLPDETGLCLPGLGWL